MSEAVISINNVTKYYKLYSGKKDRVKELLNPFGREYHKKHFALKDFNLEIHKGEVVGLVGVNGAGKSTLLKIISGVMQPNSGSVNVKGRISALLELGAGFNPEFTGYENIYFYGMLLGIDKANIDRKVSEIIEFAELGEYIHQPLKMYSSGMSARLGFAVSVSIEPDILILDEVLAVGDESFKTKCYRKMNEFFDAGKTVLYVSHNLTSINEVCSRAVLLYDGGVLADSSPKVITAYYRRIVSSRKEDVSQVVNEIAKSDRKYIASDLKDNQEQFAEDYYQEIANPTKMDNSSLNMQIINHEVFSMDGRRVNHLLTGKRYLYKYTAVFGEEIDSCRYGFGIRDIKGATYSWFLSDEYECSDVIGSKLGSIDVSFEFDCVMNSGIYFMTAGIKDENDSLVAHVVDSEVIKVSNSNLNVSGIMDCNVAIAFDK